MANQWLKILAIAIILVISFFYTLAFSPFFTATTFLAVLVSALLFFYFSSPRIKESIEAFIERNSKLLLVAIVLLSLFILYYGGLFQDGIIIFQDYSFHFYRTELLTNTLLTKFGNVIGWTKDFQAGMPEFYDYPPLPYFITSSFYYLLQGKVELAFLLRITVAMAFIMPMIGIYMLAKSLFKKSFIAFLSSVIWLGFPHIQFVFGNYTTYFAIGFAFLGLSFYYDYLNDRKGYKLLFATLFFSLTIVSNPMLIVPTLIVVLLGIKKLSLKDFILLSIGVLGISFIWFAQIYEGSEYLFYIHAQSLLVYPEWFNLFNQFFVRFLYVSPALFFLIFLGTIYKLDKSTERTLFTIILLLFFLIIVERLQPLFGLFTLLQPEKTVMFMRGFFIILSIYITYEFLKVIEIPKGRAARSLLLALITTAIIGSSIIYIPYQVAGWHDHSSDALRQFFGYNPPYLTDGIFSYGMGPAVKEAYSFLRNLTTDERVLFEDSKKDQFGSDSIIALGPYFTGKNFIGGPFYHISLEDQNATAYDGIILGKNITEYSLNDFRQKLDDFNIGYITAWSPEFINFLEKYPEEFKPVYQSSDNLLYVFQFLDSKNSYIETNSKLPAVKTTRFEDDIMQFEIENASAGDRITIKSTYNTHWKGYLDSQPIQLEKGNLHLIFLTLPKSGNFSLKIIYEKTLLEKVSPFVSVASFILILGSAIYYWRRKK